MAAGGRRIVAPVCSAAEAELALDAGADELYCGAMFDEWADVFGDSDLISRRQGRTAHVSSREEIAAVVEVATERGKPVALAANARYTRAQMALVLETIRLWEEVGGQSVLVTDLGVLLALNERGSALERHLSTLAGVFNSAAAAFFSKLGVCRIVLPRDMTLEEIRGLTSAAPKMQYEALAMYQKCEFIDGMCGFYHGTRIPSDTPAEFEYTELPGESGAVAYSPDPGYEGHGCQMRWLLADGGVVRHLSGDDFGTPHCAACVLDELGAAGVGYFKIAGRSYPPESIARATRFLRAASGDDNKALYAATFGRPCESRKCYYERERHGP
ncbi:MAG: hypothetical protein C4521_00180 [Actinobacteria bacterium]|nr:MAG: hypothetical protein C4521_00180 [Actinomycetota bacterium]